MKKTNKEKESDRGRERRKLVFFYFLCKFYTSSQNKARKMIFTKSSTLIILRI
jgi:hypothetical protein